MFKKGGKLYSILFNKCPRCHEGEFMTEKNIFKLNKAFKMIKSHDMCVNKLANVYGLSDPYQHFWTLC